jgi:hypothetical protein
MDPEREKFLNLKTPPARLNVQEAAWYLGFAPHDVPILVAAGLLKPLGHPPHTGTKYFATATLEPLRTDLKWLARASDAIVNHWQNKNGRKATEESEQIPTPRPLNPDSLRPSLQTSPALAVNAAESTSD